LLLDVGEGGRLLKARDFDEEDPNSIAETLREMSETCALDVAARGGIGVTGDRHSAFTASDIGDLMGIRLRGVEEITERAVRRIHDAEHDWEEREHPEDFYVRYSNMGQAELAELAAELRRKNRR
jgi:hypothetical protein